MFRKCCALESIQACPGGPYHCKKQKLCSIQKFLAGPTPWNNKGLDSGDPRNGFSNVNPSGGGVHKVNLEIRACHVGDDPLLSAGGCYMIRCLNPLRKTNNKRPLLGAMRQLCIGNTKCPKHQWRACSTSVGCRIYANTKSHTNGTKSAKWTASNTYHIMTI